jgi:hypothetical protein
LQLALCQAFSLMGTLARVFPGLVPRAVLRQAFSLSFLDWNQQPAMLAGQFSKCFFSLGAAWNKKTCTAECL